VGHNNSLDTFDHMVSYSQITMALKL